VRHNSFTAFLCTVMMMVGTRALAVYIPKEIKIRLFDTLSLRRLPQYYILSQPEVFVATPN
jgi:hypothetical protein